MNGFSSPRHLDIGFSSPRHLDIAVLTVIWIVVAVLERAVDKKTQVSSRNVLLLCGPTLEFVSEPLFENVSQM